MAFHLFFRPSRLTKMLFDAYTLCIKPTSKEGVMFSWIRSILQLVGLSAPFKTSQDEYSAQDHELRAWTKQMVSQSETAQNAYASRLMNQMFFRYRQYNRTIELWITSCYSGCCCNEDESAVSVLLDSRACDDWKAANRIIAKRLQEIAHDEKSKYHNRIVIESIPGCPSPNVDQELWDTVILWVIKPSVDLHKGLRPEPRVDQDAPIHHTDRRILSYDITYPAAARGKRTRRVRPHYLRPVK